MKGWNSTRCSSDGLRDRGVTTTLVLSNVLDLKRFGALLAVPNPCSKCFTWDSTPRGAFRIAIVSTFRTDVRATCRAASNTRSIPNTPPARQVPQHNSTTATRTHFRVAPSTPSTRPSRPGRTAPPPPTPRCVATVEIRPWRCDGTRTTPTPPRRSIPIDRDSTHWLRSGPDQCNFATRGNGLPAPRRRPRGKPKRSDRAPPPGEVPPGPPSTLAAGGWTLARP